MDKTPIVAMQDTFLSLLARKNAGKSGPDLKEGFAEGTRLILEVKNLLRSTFNSLEELRDGTADAKIRLDHANLQLQNHLYERNYYAKEIKSCHSFKSKYTDEDIDLIPIEDFLATAADEYKVDTDDPHKLMLKRLEHERASRVDLLKQLEEVKLKKEAADAAASAKRKVLSGLQAELQKLAESAQPLREQLGLQGVPPVNQQTALLLPQPLYLIYMQLVAAGEAYNLSIAVTITGSIPDAQAIERAAASKAAGWEQQGTNDEAERPRKRARYGLDTTDLPVPDTNAVHPLAVVLCVGDPASPLITIRFTYALAQQMVTVQCSHSADNPVLASLYPGDDGTQLPSEAAALVSAGSPSFDPNRADRPYRWAQQLGGLDLLPLVQPDTGAGDDSKDAVAEDILPVLRKQQRALALIELLRTAKPSNAALRSQLDSLQRLRLPIPLPNAVFPGTGPPAKLHSWAVLHSPLVTQPLVVGQRAGKADAKSPDAPVEGKEGEDGGESSDEEGMVKEDEENPISISLGSGEPSGTEAALGTRRFLLQARNKSLELLATVTVPATYPRQPSRVGLTELRRLPQGAASTTPAPSLTQKEHIVALAAAMEEAVNEQLIRRLSHDAEDHLLGYQVAGLLQLFGALQLEKKEVIPESE